MLRRHLRVLPLLVAAGMAIAACGSDDKGSSSPATTGAPAPTSAGEQPAPSASEQPATTAGAPASECDASKKIKFGAIYSLSGPSADIGALSKDGVSMAVEDVNAEGGVLGRCVELILKDDEGDPTKAAQVVRQLVDQDEVAVVLGPFLSSPVNATLEVTTPAKVIQITQSALTAAADPKLYPYSFTNENNSQQIDTAMAKFIERQGWTKAGIIAVNNAYGTQSIDLFTAAIKDTSVKIVGTPQLHESGKVDLNAEVGAVVGAGADVIMIFNVAGPDQTATIKARNQQAPGLPMVGSSSLYNASTTDNFTAEELETVYGGPGYTALAYRDASDPVPLGDKAAAFIDRYKKYLGVGEMKVSVSQAVGAYDGLMAAAAAINGVGSAEDPDALRAWFESNSYPGVRATLSWSATSHAGVSPDQTSFMKVKSLRDGLTQLAPGEG